jgi:hypothetical protein
MAVSGCNHDFWQDDIGLGTKATESADSTDSDSSSSADSSTVTPADDDADGLSNEVEASLGIETRIADTDHDGFADGLEYVGNRGDPLNASVNPAAENRDKLIAESEAVVSDPDSDQDGLGNSFERDNSLDENNPDIDGDGYSDGLELVAESNPFLSSSRPTRDNSPASDGISRSGAGPSDTDRDGLSDEIERLNGTALNDSDSDNDGFGDGIEYLMGSDGTDSLSIPNFNVPLPPDDSSDT